MAHRGTLLPLLLLSAAPETQTAGVAGVTRWHDDGVTVPCQATYSFLRPTGSVSTTPAVSDR